MTQFYQQINVTRDTEQGTWTKTPVQYKNRVWILSGKDETTHFEDNERKLNTDDWLGRDYLCWMCYGHDCVQCSFYLPEINIGIFMAEVISDIAFKCSSKRRTSHGKD